MKNVVESVAKQFPFLLHTPLSAKTNTIINILYNIKHIVDYKWVLCAKYCMCAFTREVKEWHFKPFLNRRFRLWVWFRL